MVMFWITSKIPFERQTRFQFFFDSAWQINKLKKNPLLKNSLRRGKSKKNAFNKKNIFGGEKGNGTQLRKVVFH